MHDLAVSRTGRAVAWVAWVMVAVFAVGWVVMVALAVVNRSFARDPGIGAVLLAFTAFMVVGVLVVARRPANAIGWIFSAIGLLGATGLLAGEYAQYAYVIRRQSLPGAIVAAWYWEWVSYPWFGLTVLFTLLLFPTGRLLSRRWRPVAWMAGILMAVVTTLAALRPTLTLPDGQHAVPNPIGIAGVDPDQGTAGVLNTGLLVLTTLAAFLSLILRFRRAQGEERQQLKWFLYAGALVIFFLVTGPVLPGEGALGTGLVIALLPVAAGIAILKYRLYDIDRLINRTLVYGLLTALLGGLYAGAVLVLGQVFGAVGSDPPSWAVAASTLAVATLFQPARRRIQQLVDRRFNRRKYNATKTVEAFSTRLRDQVDLDTLSAELLAVVDQTVQPTRSSLWLRPPRNVDRDRRDDGATILWNELNGLAAKHRASGVIMAHPTQKE
jgi:hypothetical protein